MADNLIDTNISKTVRTEFFGLTSNFSLKTFYSYDMAQREDLEYVVEEVIKYINNFKGKSTYYTNCDYIFLKRGLTKDFIEIRNYKLNVAAFDIEAQHITFEIIDPKKVSRRFDYIKLEHAFRDTVNLVIEISEYKDWEHYDLHHKVVTKHSELVEKLQLQIAQLEASNKELQLKLDNIYESKTDLRKLAQLLYLEN